MAKIIFNRDQLQSVASLSESAGATFLANLSDVVITAPVDVDNVLKFDGVNWVNGTGGGGGGAINDLTDVSVSLPAINQVLTYDGINWTNTSNLDLTQLNIDNIDLPPWVEYGSFDLQASSAFSTCDTNIAATIFRDVPTAGTKNFTQVIGSHYNTTTTGSGWDFSGIIQRYAIADQTTIHNTASINIALVSTAADGVTGAIDVFDSEVSIQGYNKASGLNPVGYDLLKLTSGGIEFTGDFSSNLSSSQFRFALSEGSFSHGGGTAQTQRMKTRFWKDVGINTATLWQMDWVATVNTNDASKDIGRIKWQHDPTRAGLIGENTFIFDGNIGGTNYQLARFEPNNKISFSLDDVFGNSKLDITHPQVECFVPFKLVNMTTANRDTLTPEPGWMIFNTTTNKTQSWDGTVWVDLH